MKTSQNLHQINLRALINRLGEGRFVIPDFQRGFEWESKHIHALTRSIFLDYYIGSLLLWNQQDYMDALSCERVYGYPEEQDASPEHIVLDGQQRLTAMYYTFFAPDVPPNEKKRKRVLYFIKVDQFVEGNYDHAFESYSNKYGERVLVTEELQYQEHLFPLAIVGAGGERYYNWFQRYKEYWKEKESLAQENGDSKASMEAQGFIEAGDEFKKYAEDLLTEYKISYVELSRDLDIAKVCDIFTQLNRSGVQLNTFDLMNALLKPKDIRLRSELWRDAESQYAFFDEIREMNVYALQVMSIIRQSVCDPKFLYYLIPERSRSFRAGGGATTDRIIVESRSDFLDLWDKSVAALDRSLTLLRNPQEFGVIAPRFLPYASVLPVFAALRVAADASGPDAHRKIRLWYWASVFTNRYTGPVWSTASRDYLDVCSWISNDEYEPGLISEFKETIHGLNLRSETRAFNAVYRGIFNLFIIRGAEDWQKGTVPQYDDLDDHHIVPKSWGKENGVGDAINTILNRTPLSKDTNRKIIKDRLPNEYLPDLIAENGEASVRSIFESHLISPLAFEILRDRDPFTPDDFEDFITARQRTIHSTIESLLLKERIDLDPNLRDVDDAIEKIELDLRTCIDEALGGSIEQIKGLHFFPKVNERIEGALKRNRALDPDRYATLSGKLEYFDLREIEDTIKAKQLWDRFADRFGSKDALAMRFGQLGEIRNAIRHSRTADEVTRRDGEAAIAWFRGALGRKG